MENKNTTTNVEVNLFQKKPYLLPTIIGENMKLRIDHISMINIARGQARCNSEIGVCKHQEVKINGNRKGTYLRELEKTSWVI